jgi:hypothetical protein
MLQTSIITNQSFKNSHEWKGDFTHDEICYHYSARDFHLLLGIFPQKIKESTGLRANASALCCVQDQVWRSVCMG